MAIGRLSAPELAPVLGRIPALFLILYPASRSSDRPRERTRLTVEQTPRPSSSRHGRHDRVEGLGGHKWRCKEEWKSG
jgi:hypothetical protein